MRFTTPIYRDELGIERGKPLTPETRREAVKKAVGRARSTWGSGADPWVIEEFHEYSPGDLVAAQVTVSGRRMAS